MNPYLVSWLRFNDENDIAKDECGNTWTIDDSPTLTTENAILGKALQLTRRPWIGLTLQSQLIDVWQDFSVDLYKTVVANGDASLNQDIKFTFGTVNAIVAAFSSSRFSSKLQVGSVYKYFSNNSVQIGERHHFAWSYVAKDKMHYFWMDGTARLNFVSAIDTPLSSIEFKEISTGNTSSKTTIDEFRVFSGIALWTESFTPPTTEADYDLTECPFSVFMPATRSIVKPIDTLANVKRTVDKTADEFSNLASGVVLSENIFSNAKRTVDKTADESANVKREVTVSTVNDFSPIRRTVNASDNFANFKSRVIKSTDDFSPTKRTVLFSNEYDFQPHRRLTNLADEFAPVRRLVHEPQVVDIYTRRRLVNLVDNVADARRQILFTTDSDIDLSRAVIFTADNFSPTKRTVDKIETESANTKRQILFSTDNECVNIRRVINTDDNFANVTSSVFKSTDNFAPTLREILRTEIYSVETSRRAELLSVIIALKSQQGETLGLVRFLKNKTSSIGHLVTRLNDINFYAGLVPVDSPTASNFRVMANGALYAVQQN